MNPSIAYRDLSTRQPRSLKNVKNLAVQPVYTIMTEYFQSTATKKLFKIRHSFTCNSNKVIYLITCANCKKQYVGKTTRTLRERVCQHRHSIKKNQDQYVSKHFNLPGHNLSHLTIQAIDTADNNQEQLTKLEEYWINTLKTVQPKGLNVNNEQNHLLK